MGEGLRAHHSVKSRKQRVTHNKQDQVLIEELVTSRQLGFRSIVNQWLWQKIVPNVTLQNRRTETVRSLPHWCQVFWPGGRSPRYKCLVAQHHV